MNLLLQAIREYLKENHLGWVATTFFNGVILIESTTSNEYYVLVDQRSDELSLCHTLVYATTKNDNDTTKYKETAVKYTESTLLQQINEIILAL